MQRLFSTIVAVILIILFIGFGFTDAGSGLNDLLDSDRKTETAKSTVIEKTEIKGSLLDLDNKQKLEKDEAIVSRVIDGDTVLVIDSDGNEERVRLLLIDTPESVHPDGLIEAYGIEASDYAKEYLKQGKTVTLEKGVDERDKYDRLLAHLWVDGVNFNKHMVEMGYARVAYVYEPNTKYADEFRKAEQEAKKKKINIWSIDSYVTDKGFDMSVVE